MSLTDKIKKSISESADIAFGTQSVQPMFVQSEKDLVSETKEKAKEEKTESSESKSSSSSSSSSSETGLNEAEIAEIKLSASSLRSLANAYIAEAMVEEVISEDADLTTFGLMAEGKLTEKGRALLKKYLPTIFAS